MMHRHHQINRCHGACVGKEPADEYNFRVDTAIEKYIYRENNFFVLDKGRSEDEHAVVKVCNGAYQGFGYIDKEDVDNKVLLNACIKPYADNKDIQVIVKGYLRKYPDTKVLGVKC
jgi:DNA polymerase-3 subunit epsilon